MSRFSDYIDLAIAIHGLALAIVNLTPTPKDDLLVAKLYRAIEILAGIIDDRNVKH